MEINLLNIYVNSIKMLLFTFQVCLFKNQICASAPDSRRLVCSYLLDLQNRILAMPSAHVFRAIVVTQPRCPVETAKDRQLSNPAKQKSGHFKTLIQGLVKVNISAVFKCFQQVYATLNCGYIVTLASFPVTN